MRHTDTKEMARLFEELFGRDRICRSCRTRKAIGAHRLHTERALCSLPDAGDSAAVIVSLCAGHAVTRELAVRLSASRSSPRVVLPSPHPG